MTPMLAFLLSLALAAGAASAPDSTQDPRLRARLDPATARSVEQLIDSARTRMLPIEPLIQKALEGNTKGAPGPRIVAAVAALLDGLGQARLALGIPATADELQAGVLWLRAGGGADRLRRIREAAPDRPLAVPIAVSAELLGRGWPAAEAAEALERLFRARVPDAGFLSLRTGVNDAIRGGSGLVPAVRAEVARLVPDGARP